MELEEANRQFVRQITLNQRRIYGYILSLVPNWDAANEILQETMIRLWEEFQKFDPESDFLAWAIRVAYFQVLTWRKRVGRSKLVFDQSFIDAVSEQYSAAIDSRDARHQALGKCLEQLTAKNRHLLASCYAPGARIRQVAQALNRTPDSVYKALRRLRLALLKCIEIRLAEEQQP